MTDLGIAATILSVVTGVIAVFVFVAATSAGSRVFVFTVLAGARTRTVALTLHRLGLGRRSHIAAEVRAIVLDQLSGAPYNVATELEWLSRVSRGTYPVTFADPADDPRFPEAMRAVADAYQRLASRCRSRLLVGARGSELVSRQAEVAESAAQALRTHSSNTAYLRTDHVEILDLRARGAFVRLLYADENMDCAVSPFPSRMPAVPETLSADSSRPRFDGILPYLLAHRLERDRESGRTRLHLAIAETPYSFLRSLNVGWNPDAPEPPRPVARHAITLAMLPVTSDGKVLLSRRAAGAGSYPGMVGPYVTGNAELRDRHGVLADRDLHGLPDLLGAVCRESHEEVGLQLRPTDLRVLGLAQIWSPEDTGIWCLLTTSALPISAAEVSGLTRFADPVEGSWEVGHEVYALSPWRSPDGPDRLLQWAAGQPDLVPHAVACLAALFRKSGTPGPGWWSSAAASPPSWPEDLIETLPARHPFR